MKTPVLERLRSLLVHHGAQFTEMTHEPVYTSEQASRTRGTPIESGAKALVCKANDDFLLFVMPAHLQLSTKRVRKSLKIQRLRFATGEELLKLTGLEPGCVPPFGSLFFLPTWCDVALKSVPRINFSAGAHTVSMSLLFDDYARIECPHWARIALDDI